MAVNIVMIIGAAIVTFLIGFDIYLAADKIDNNTWSEIIRRFALSTTFVSYGCGVLSGHFFHPGTKALFGQPNSIALLIWTACVVTGIGVAFMTPGREYLVTSSFILGFVGGILLWPVT